MNKIIFVALAIFLSVQAQNVTDNDVVQFIEGFGPAVGQPNATLILVNCTQNNVNDLIEAVRGLITDLQNKNFTGAWDDFVEVVEAINELKGSCPDGAEPFLQEFEPAIAAYNQSRTEFLDEIARDLSRDPVGTAEALAGLGYAFKGQDYYNAGGNFGDLVMIALAAFLNNTESVQDEFDFRSVFAVKFDEDFHFETSGESSGSSTDAIEFFEGFASAFGLQSAAESLIQCVDTTPSQLISDIENLISDAGKGDWSSVANDMVSIFGDIQNLVSECSEGALPFVSEFEPVISDLDNDSSQFWDTVGDNIKANIGNLLAQTGELIQDIEDSDYEKSGNALGNMLFITLKGILPNANHDKAKFAFLNLVRSIPTFRPSDRYDASGETSGETSGESSGDSTDAIEFLEGFASAFGLQTAAQALVQCVDTTPSNLISQIESLIQNAQNSQWADVATDLFQIYDSIQDLVSECSDGAGPFVSEFEPIFSDYQNDSSQFWDNVETNIKGNTISLLADTAAMIAEFADSQWEQAGNTLGKINLVTLKGILPNDN